MRKCLNSENCMFKSKRAQRLITTALANAPLLSNVMAPIFSCIVKAVLVELDVSIKNASIVNIVLSCSQLSLLQEKQLIDTLAYLRKMVQNAKIHGAFDGANKGIHHIVKGVSLLNKEKHNIFTFFLDNDASLDDNVADSKVINTSFTKLNSLQ